MRADRLVLSDRGTTELAASVLADTWVVKSIEVAIDLATGPGQGLRFVSLQGELLESNGSLYVGTVRSETSLLSRKSELRRLRNDLSLLDRDIAAAEQTLQSMYQSLTGADSELESMAAELDYANQRLADLKGELVHQDQTLERLRREQLLLSQQWSASEAERIGYAEELVAAETKAVQTEQDLEQLEGSLNLAEERILDLERQNRELEQKHTEDQLDLVKQGERLESLRGQLSRLSEELQQRNHQHDEAERRCAVAIAKRSQIGLQILNTRAVRDEKILVAEQIQSTAQQLNREKMALRTERSLIAEQEQAIRKQRHEVADRHHANEIRVRDIRNSLENLNERLEEEYQIKVTEAVESGLSAFDLFVEERNSKPAHSRTKNRKDQTPSDEPIETTSVSTTDDDETSSADNEETFAPDADSSIIESNTLHFKDVRPELDARVNRLRKQLKLMGTVNIDSLQDLEMQETRFTQLSAQLQDLVEAKLALEDIIRKINVENRRIFIETFETIRKNFQELFRQVFGGGEGDIILEDPDDVLECGIDIAARPPGKELRSISLLSGGEKTMTAIGLIMAIFKSKPSPFCILDEVDAALDDANVERFTSVIKEFQQNTQFIMITHHKRSMTIADLLYGVTMEESGVSKRMSVRFEDVSDDGNFTAPPQTSAA
jgi:chromosome segregation protein